MKGIEAVERPQLRDQPDIRPVTPCVYTLRSARVTSNGSRSSKAWS